MKDAYLEDTKEQSRNGYKKIICLVAVFLSVILFRSVLIERIIVDGNSMNPTLENYDICLMKKCKIEPKRYDIVVAKMQGRTVIKRVIGMPGETLNIKDEKIFIDGSPVETKYDFTTQKKGLLSKPFTLKENEYFLMGDNRGESWDSRDFGSVEINNVKGIVLCRIFPFNKFEIYK